MRRAFYLSSFAITAIVVALTAFFHVVPGAAEPIRRIADAALSPLAKRINAVPATTQDEALRDAEATIAVLEQENAALRRSQAVAGTLRRSRVMTRVLWSDPDPSRRAFRVAVPEGTSFSVGDVVVAPGDVLVGTVIAMYPRSADVRRIDDPEFRARVVINDALALATGNGRGGMDLSLIPADAQWEQGASVRSAGDIGVPQDFLVGYVAVQKADTAESPPRFSVIPPARLDRLNVLFIVPITADVTRQPR